MATLNVYLQRAMRSSSPITSNVSKGIHGAAKYTDNLLGVSAAKARAQAQAAAHISSKVKTPYAAKLATKLQGRADNLTTSTSKTRIATGLGIGGAALVHKALKNSGQSQSYTDYNDYSNYSY